MNDEKVPSITDVGIAIAGSVDAGKCHRGGTLIMMHDGTFKKVEDVVIGDNIMGDDSKPRRVAETHTGIDQLYKIIPVNGTSYEVTKNHILCLKYSSIETTSHDKTRNRVVAKYQMIENKLPVVKCKQFLLEGRSVEDVQEEAKNFLNNTDKMNHGDVIEISVEDFMALKPHIKDSLKWYRTGISFAECNLPFDPYMLGIWLGDGTSSNTNITTADNKIVEYFTEHAKQYNLDFQKLNAEYGYSLKQLGNRRQKGGNYFLNFLKEYNLLNNKHIPDIYKYNSRENRLKLLAGLIDSDGYYGDKNTYSFTMCNKYMNLINDMIYLIRSLGFSTYAYNKLAVCTNGANGRVEVECTKFEFSGGGQEDIPCILPRKKADKRNTKKSNMVTGITIEKSIIDNYYGFTLDGNGRFLLGDFSVAHNSSFIGVVTTGVLDDGNGKARESVAKHPHEIATGRTSDISTRMMRVPGTNRAITMIDLCGHEKYLKTTASGISGNYPDYAFVIVAANRGILPMTKQHFQLLMSLSVPIAIILTRADITPRETYMDTRESIELYCQKFWKTRVNFVNDYYDTNETPAYAIEAGKLVNELLTPPNGRQMFIPVITVSNKTGYFVETVKTVMSTLKPRELWDNFDLEHDAPEEFGKDDSIVSTMPPELKAMCKNRVIRGFMTNMPLSIFPTPTKMTGTIVYISEVFGPPGVGMVLSCMVRGDEIKPGSTLFVGPMGSKDPFENELRVKSIHNGIKEFTSYLGHHHRGCIAVAGVTKKDMVTRDQIKRGMVLVNPKSLAQNVCWRFKAVVTVFNHPATLKSGYSPNLHMGTIRQTVRMILDPEKNDGKTEIKSGDYAQVTFKFKMNPEYVEPYQVFFFRSGGIHGIGTVVGIVPLHEDTDAKPDPVKYKRRFVHKRDRAKIDKRKGNTAGT